MKLVESFCDSLHRATEVSQRTWGSAFPQLPPSSPYSTFYDVVYWLGSTTLKSNVMAISLRTHAKVGSWHISRRHSCISKGLIDMEVVMMHQIYVQINVTVVIHISNPPELLWIDGEGCNQGLETLQSWIELKISDYRSHYPLSQWDNWNPCGERGILESVEVNCCSYVKAWWI